MSAKAGAAASAAPNRRQRRYPRYRCSFPVVVTLFAGDKYQPVDAHCKDLSPAGIGILLGAELALGEVVSLNFSLPESTPKGPATTSSPWELRAVLRHRLGYHFGFEFLSLTKEESATIRHFVQGLPRAD